jgi:hypothetical protein
MPRRLRMIDGGRMIEEHGESPYRSSATDPAAPDPVSPPDAGAAP